MIAPHGHDLAFRRVYRPLFVMSLFMSQALSAPPVRSMRAFDRAPAIILPAEKICNHRVELRPRAP
jgi:hypothetical protein